MSKERTDLVKAIKEKGKTIEAEMSFFDHLDVSVLPLISELDFIPNKQSWGYPFRFGFLEINRHDFDLISNQMLQRQNG